jgi:hypothetical protein
VLLGLLLRKKFYNIDSSMIYGCNLQMCSYKCIHHTLKHDNVVLNASHVETDSVIADKIRHFLEIKVDQWPVLYTCDDHK